MCFQQFTIICDRAECQSWLLNNSLVKYAHFDKPSTNAIHFQHHNASCRSHPSNQSLIGFTFVNYSAKCPTGGCMKLAPEAKIFRTRFTLSVLQGWTKEWAAGCVNMRWKVSHCTWCTKTHHDSFTEPESHSFRRASALIFLKFGSRGSIH